MPRWRRVSGVSAPVTYSIFREPKGRQRRLGIVGGNEAEDFGVRGKIGADRRETIGPLAVNGIDIFGAGQQVIGIGQPGENGLRGPKRAGW